MDSDSFLEIMSPGFNDFDLSWGPADGGACTVQASTVGWLSDGFINAEGFLSDDTEEEGEDGDSDTLPIMTAFSSCKRSASTANSSVLSNSSETYSSVLKLSDVASALHNFSRAALSPTTHRRQLRPPVQKALTEQSIPVGYLSPCIEASCFADPSPLENVCALSLPIPDDAALTQSHTADVVSQSHERDVLASATMSPSVDKIDTLSRQVFESPGAVEKESSSKVSSDGGSGWDASDNEDDDDEDVEGSPDLEDSKSLVSHVRIIRRPNSNCGHVMESSPKRLKLDNVKVEVTSSSDTANAQDDKDGASSLSRMRKEGMSQREVHILSERQRRKSMRESFSILQSLVPKLKLKHTDRITVLTEVIAYIHSLRGTIEELERKKADIMDLLGLSSKTSAHGPYADVQGTVTYVNTDENCSSDEKMGSSAGGWCSLQNGERVAMVEVTVRVCGVDVFVTLSMPQCRGLWSGVLQLLQKYSIDVLYATLATSGDSSFHCIHAKATSLSRLEGVDLQEKLEGVLIKELRRPVRRGQF